MIDERDFGGEVGIIGSGRSIYVLSLFIFNIGLARSLKSSGYGSFQQVFMFSVLFMIFSLGIPETLYYFLPRLSKEEWPGFIGQTFIVLTGAGITVASLLWFGAPLLAGLQKNPAIEMSIRFFGVYGAFIILSSCSDPIFIIFKRIKYLFVLSAIHGLFFIGLTAWQYVTNCSIRSLFGAMAGFGLVKLVLALYYVNKMGMADSPLFSRTFLRVSRTVFLQLSFALPIALSNTIDIVSRWLDKFVISFFLGTEPLGIFSVGAIEIPFVSVFVSSVFSVASPVLNSCHHRGDTEGFVAMVVKAIKFTSKVIWPLGLYLMIFADHLIPLVFTHEYDHAVAPFRIYLLMMPLRIFLLGVILIGLGKPRIVLMAAFWSLVINAVLNVLFVIKIGFLGPAIATVVSTYIQVIILVWFILVNLNIGIRELIPFRTLFDIVLTSSLAAMIAYMLTRAFHSDLKAVLTSLAIFVGAYLFMGSRVGLFRIVSAGDIMKGNFLGKKDKD